MFCRNPRAVGELRLSRSRPGDGTFCSWLAPVPRQGLQIQEEEGVGVLGCKYRVNIFQICLVWLRVLPDLVARWDGRDLRALFACLSPSRDGVSVGGDLSPLWCLGMENPYAALKADLEGSSLLGVQQGFYSGSVSWHFPSARVVSNICFWRVELSMLWRWHILSASPFFSLLVLWFCW